MTDNDLLHRLDMATIASCSCQTKTPELRDHDPMCWYRLFSEAASELRDLQQTFDLQWEADMRAVRQWREAHPGNEVLLMPDRANMVVWLLERLDAALAATPAVGGEIVAWRWEDRVYKNEWVTTYSDTKPDDPDRSRNLTPLYAAQPASPLRGRDKIAAMLKHNKLTSRDGSIIHAGTYDVIDAILSFASPPEQPAAAPVTGRPD